MKLEIFSTPKEFTKLFFILIAIPLFFKASYGILNSHVNQQTQRPNVGIDFVAYMTGSLVLKTQPQDLYNINVQTEVQKNYLKEDIAGLLSYRNTPFVAFLNLPYTLINPNQSYFINYIVQTILLLIYAWLLLKVIILKENKPNIKHFIVLTFMYYPMWYVATFGQISPLIAIILVCIYGLLKNNKPFWVGILSVLLILKLQYIILIPFLFLIVKDKKSFLKGLSISFIGMLMLDSLLYRGFYLVEYLKFLALSEKDVLGTNLEKLVSISVIFNIFKASSTVIVTTLALLYGSFLIFIEKSKQKISLEIIYSLMILFIVFINYHTAMVDLIFLLIPIILLYMTSIKENNTKAKITAISLFLIPWLTAIELHALIPVIGILASIYLIKPTR